MSESNQELITTTPDKLTINYNSENIGNPKLLALETAWALYHDSLIAEDQVKTIQKAILKGATSFKTELAKIAGIQKAELALSEIQKDRFLQGFPAIPENKITPSIGLPGILGSMQSKVETPHIESKKRKEIEEIIKLIDLCESKIYFLDSYYSLEGSTNKSESLLQNNIGDILYKMDTLPASALIGLKNLLEQTKYYKSGQIIRNSDEVIGNQLYLRDETYHQLIGDLCKSGISFEYLSKGNFQCTSFNGNPKGEKQYFKDEFAFYTFSGVDFRWTSEGQNILGQSFSAKNIKFWSELGPHIKFVDCNLDYSDFSGSDMRFAEFLEGTTLNNADLTDVDFRSARLPLSMKNSILSGVVVNAETFREGFGNYTEELAAKQGLKFTDK